MLLPLVDSTSFSGLESIPKNYAQIGYFSKRNKRSNDFFPKNSREFPKNQSRSSGIPKSRKFSIPNFGNPEIPKIPIPKFWEFPNPENFGNPELRESRKKISGKSPTLIYIGYNYLNFSYLMRILKELNGNLRGFDWNMTGI